MTILALEFSSEQRSVAVLRELEGSVSSLPKKDGAPTKQCPPNKISEAIETGGRSTAAFGMIERVLAEARIEREEIDAIAIGIGPGSYTGIRSAIAIAQGWQLARKIKLVGVSSVEAITAQAQAKKIFGDVSVVIDAQRGEIYLARYEISETAAKEIDLLKIVSPEKVGLSRRDDRTAQRAVPTFVGPEATKWFPSGEIIFPRAATIAKLAASKSDFVSGEKLEPIYLRKTDFVKSPPPRIIA